MGSSLMGSLGQTGMSSLSGTLHDHYNSQLTNSLESMEQQRLMLQNLQRTGKQQQWVNEQLGMMNSQAGNWYKYNPQKRYENLSNIQTGEVKYVANRDNERADRDREARRVLRNYWSIRVGNNTHYKNLRDFDDFLSNLEIYLQSNPERIPVEEVQQKHGYYLIEQSNLQALRGIYQRVAETADQSKRRIIEIGGILTTELRKDERGDTCTQRFINEL